MTTLTYLNISSVFTCYENKYDLSKLNLTKLDISNRALIEDISYLSSLRMLTAPLIYIENV